MKEVFEKTIEIQADVSKVWEVFTNPVLTRVMGGEYVSDWKVGSSFGWKALDGNMYTHGSILRIEPNKILQHNLFDSQGTVTSIITYELADKDGATLLHAKEVFANPVSDEDYADIESGWDAALEALKKTAEGS